jgi:DNA-binding response OmpR family regulator
MGVVHKAIMVVEDEFLIRLLVVQILSDAGFDVLEAEDGNRASDILDEADALHLLITDINLPGGLDGNDVALKAKARFGDIPVIYLSGRPDSLRNSLGRRDTFIPKPYTLSALGDTQKLPLHGGTLGEMV